MGLERDGLAQVFEARRLGLGAAALRAVAIATSRSERAHRVTSRTQVGGVERALRVLMQPLEKGL